MTLPDPPPTGRLVLAEDAAIVPSSFAIDGAAAFADDGAAISVIAIGNWPPARTEWWRQFGDDPNVAGAAGALRSDGVVFRALAVHLGAAQSLLRRVEAAARSAISCP